MEGRAARECASSSGNANWPIGHKANGFATPEFTFDSRGDMTLSEAVLAIESLLSINGIGVTPLGDKFLKVVAINTIRTEAPELGFDSLQDRAQVGKSSASYFVSNIWIHRRFSSKFSRF